MFLIETTTSDIVWLPGRRPPRCLREACCCFPLKTTGSVACQTGIRLRNPHLFPGGIFFSFLFFLLQSRPVSSQSGWIKGSSTGTMKTASSPPAIISDWTGGELHLGPADGTWLNPGGEWGPSARWFCCYGALSPPPSQALGSISWKQVIQREPFQASLAFVLM